MPATGKRNRGCDNCRRSHLKCDGEEPCARCIRKRLPCGRNFKVRFRIYEQSRPFSDTQRWVRTSGKRTQFIDQSQEISSLYDDGIISEDGHPAESEANTSPPVAGRISPAAHRPSFGRDYGGEGFATLPHISEVLRLSPDRRTPTHLDLGPLGARLASPRHNLELPAHYNESILTQASPSSDPRLSKGGDCPRSEELQVSTVGSSNFFDHFVVPGISFYPPSDQAGTLVKSRAEADLIRHFVDNMAPALELYDPARNFTTEIVQRATADPVLLESILTVSAKHLNKPRYVEPRVEAQYQRQLLQYEVLVRYDRNQPIDENLFGAVLLHRLDQNCEGTSYNAGIETPHLDILSILTLQALSLPQTQFSQNLFWSSLRQELYIAVMNESTVKIDSRDIQLDRSTEPADDCTWANRITLHLLDVIQFCFAGEQNIDAFNSLREYSTTWMESKPASFTPIFIGEPSHGGILPEIWLFNDFVAAGLQYYYLCHLLLMAHDPKAPRLGIKQKEARRWMEDQIKDYVKIICGIAESIGTVNHAHIMACMAISLAGDRFTQPNEQEVFFNILTKTTKMYGWNTTAAKQTLREAWKCHENIV